MLLLLALAPLGHAADRGPIDTFLSFIGPLPANTPARPESFREYLLATVGPAPVFGEALGAAIGQWANAPEEWGQGWGAYGKRYASNLAYNGIRQTITYAGSLALRQDTRYVACSCSGFWPRTRHALVSTFTARRPDGSSTFSIASTAGVLGAGTLASVWGPPSWKGPANIAHNAGISFAATAGTNVFREFLPDLLRRTRK